MYSSEVMLFPKWEKSPTCFDTHRSASGASRTLNMQPDTKCIPAPLVLFATLLSDIKLPYTSEDSEDQVQAEMNYIISGKKNIN